MPERDLSSEELANLLPAYRLEEMVASGDAGAVWRGRQRSLDRPVTIKVLHSQYARKPRFRDAFEREARTTANLNHPNLLAIYEFGEIAGHLFLVSEYVHGKPLANSARGRAVDPAQAAQIVAGICRGLAHLHEHGVLHRDLKPANILLTPSFEPKIGDFGLAHGPKHHGHDDSGYLAPELNRDPHAFSEATDIHAVGAILHELLTGQPAAAGLGAEQLNRIHDLRLREIVAKATHKNPARRHGSAREFCKELDSWLKVPTQPAAGKLMLPGTDRDPATTRPSAIPAAPYAAADPAEAAKLGAKLAIIVILSFLVVFLAWLLSHKRDKVRQQEDQHRREQQALPRPGIEPPPPAR